MSDKTWMSPEELTKCSRAFDVESEEFCSPIPTQNVSNGEYLPKPQSEKQKQVEARIKEIADDAAKKLGVSRRDFLAGSGGMAASLIAMNDVYGKFFDVDKNELFEPAAHDDGGGLPSDVFVVDDQLHFVRGNTRTTLGAPALRAIAQGGKTREGNFFSDAYGFAQNPFNPDNLRDEAHNEPYYPWNKALAAEYLANPNKYVNEVNAFTAPYSGVQNLDAKGAGDAFHFLRFIKSVFLDSQVTVGLISNVTTFVDAQPGTNLPVTNVDEARSSEILTAAQTANARNFINDIAGSRRAMAHGLMYVGKANLEYIQYQTENHRPDAWKGYCVTHAAQPGRSALSTGPGRNRAPLDTSPNATMKLWRHDDEEVAYPTFELISKYYKKLKDEIPGFNNICVHKGLAHGLDDMNFVTYHSCIKDTFFDYFAWQEVVAAERGDRGSTRVVQGKRVPDISWTTEFCDLTGKFKNSYAELGSTFAGSIITFPTLWAHIIGQLLMFKGEDQIIFGSDSLWYGTPQWQLEAFWRFQIPDQIRQKWGYPKISDNAKRKILGLNAARIYGLDGNVKKYSSIPSDYASRVPKQLKDLLEWDNGKVNLTAQNDNLSKIKARYLESGAQRSNMRYGWLRTST